MQEYPPIRVAQRPRQRPEEHRGDGLRQVLLPLGVFKARLAETPPEAPAAVLHHLGGEGAVRSPAQRQRVQG